MILVLGLRDWISQGRRRKVEKFFENNWRFASVKDVFDPEKLQDLIAKVPEEERYNLYYTVADCFEETGRKLKEQWAIPFDIDGLEFPEGKEVEHAINVAHVACRHLGVKYEETSIVFSGNGVQIIIHTTKPITDEGYFDKARKNYATICAKLQLHLDEQQIKGHVDTSVWSKARLLRLPMTENRKDNKPTRMARILSTGTTSIEYDVVEQSGVAFSDEPEAVVGGIIKNYPQPDTKAVCEGCKFLTWCKENPAKVREPQWYAETSVLARLEDGRSLVHSYSEGHPDYNAYETDNKIDQALNAAGPRTCANISTLWDGCPSCEYYGKVTSPIMIRGPGYIASADFGFRQRKVTKNGVLPGPVAQIDLKNAFYKQFPYKSVEDTGQIIVYNGKYWEHMTDMRIKGWAMERVQPEPTTQEMTEFVGILKAFNITSLKELQQSSEGMINFENVALDTRDGSVHPHSPDYGFFDCRPFPYDAHATAPVFEKFMLDIMSGDTDRVQLLKEFIGYCISGDRYWLHKCLVIYGHGSNGKSVLMNMMAALVGDLNHSTVSMQDITNATMRHQLVNKLFNYSEETGLDAFKDTSLFKSMTSGGAMMVKQLYVQPFSIPNKAKIIISTNELPRNKDASFGFERRLIIVEFRERFTVGDGRYDRDIDAKLAREVAGICNSVLAAYKQVKETGKFSAEDKVTTEVDKFKKENDPVTSFIEDVVEMSPTAPQVPVSEVYQAYAHWCMANNHRPANNISFGKQFSKWTHASTDVVRFGETTKRVYNGVRLKKDF